MEITKSERRERKRFEKRWNKYDHGSEDMKHFFTILNAFLRLNVNRPYEKVYGDWCAKYPNYILGDTNTRWWFKHHCGMDEYGLHNPSVFPYYIDNNGFIKKNQNYRNSGRCKDIIIGYNDAPTDRWEINKEVFKKEKTSTLLRSKVGEYNARILEEEKYIPTKLLDILFNIQTEMIHRLIDANWHNISIEKNREKYNWFIRKATQHDPIIVKYGSPEYYRYIAEKEVKKKKEMKEKKLEKEKISSTLLHDIEEKRKSKIKEKDIVDRDRLGFDEQSFKGEFYHGQKRKK